MKITKKIILAVAASVSLLNAQGLLDVQGVSAAGVDGVSVKAADKRSGVYLGLGYTHGSLEYTSGPLVGEDSYGPLTVALGYKLDNYMSVEGRYSSSADFIQEVSGREVRIEDYGVYLKPSFSLVDNTRLYGLLGWGKVSTGETNGQNVSETNNLGFGGGLSYRVARDTNLFVDYVNLSNPMEDVETDTKIQKVTFGFSYLF